MWQESRAAKKLSADNGKKAQQRCAAAARFYFNYDCVDLARILQIINQ